MKVTDRFGISSRTLTANPHHIRGPGFNVRPLYFIDQTLDCRSSIAQFTLPDDENPPIFVLEQELILLVTPYISSEFLEPRLSPSGRHASPLAAAMSVPVTSVHKYDRAVLWQYDVRSTGQLFNVLAESEASSMK